MSDLSGYFQPFESQKKALKYIGAGIRMFFGGARGGGKTRFAIMAAVLACLKYPNLKTICIRETFNELEEGLIRELLENYPTDVFKYKYNSQYHRAIFSNGSRIVFKSCDSEPAAKKIQGLEYQLMIIDEANNLSQRVLTKLTGSLRRTKTLKGFIPTFVMTGNPGGLADFYFKTRFVDPDYSQWSETELKYKDNYIFIPSNVYDNPMIGDEYVEWLEQLEPKLKAAWLYGRWDVFEGQFFDTWNPNLHIIKEFEIPKHWSRACGLDLGYSTDHPTVCLWVAQDPIKKTLYVYNEYIQSTNNVEYINDLKGMMGGKYHMPIIWVDPSAFIIKEREKWSSESTAFTMIRNGLPLQAANNERINGWRVLKQWLRHDENNEPLLKIMDNCRQIIGNLPILKFNSYRTNGRPEEDLDTRQPGDDYADALRYVVVSGFIYPEMKNIEVPLEDKVQEAMRIAVKAHPRESQETSGYVSYRGRYNLSIARY